MGCTQSSGGKAKIYTEQDEDSDLIAEFQPHFDQLADGAKGVPIGSLCALYDAVTENGQPLSEREKAAAASKLDPENRGYFSLSAFVRWFQIPSQAYEEPAPAAPEVHENVRRGIKDEGEAEGTAQYDAEMAAKARAEAEAELRAMAAGREASSEGPG